MERASGVKLPLPGGLTNTKGTNPHHATFTSLHSSDYLLERLEHSMEDYRVLSNGGFDARYLQLQITSTTARPSSPLDPLRHIPDNTAINPFAIKYLLHD